MRSALVLTALCCGALAAQPSEPPFWERLRQVISRNLNRPYVWGASGLKSFDCSGFVWRVMHDNGVLIKRTTARKYYFSLPAVPASRQWDFGNIVFFDDLRHCGIVNGRGDFYHAESSRGTTLSQFDPYWRGKVCAIRRMPGPPRK